jgi:hypothetical protein
MAVTCYLSLICGRQVVQIESSNTAICVMNFSKFPFHIFMSKWQQICTQKCLFAFDIPDTPLKKVKQRTSYNDNRKQLKNEIRLFYQLVRLC